MNGSLGAGGRAQSQTGLLAPPKARPCPLTESTCLAQEDDFHPPHLHNILLSHQPIPCSSANAPDVGPRRLVTAALGMKHRDTKVAVFISVAAGWRCLQASPPSFATRRTCRVPETITDMLELIVSCVDMCTVSDLKGFKQPLC